jgi:putative phosphoribosyl transferase
MTLNTSDTEHPVIIPCGNERLEGLIHIPLNPIGVVLFTHGSGNSRFSARNQFLARVLNEAGIATLLFDLLTPKEEAIDALTFEYRFNIEHLKLRLVAATDWLAKQLIVQGLPLGYLGASTGAGAALSAAVTRKSLIKAIVVRGGRPDLAGEALNNVVAPTLLLIGGNDTHILDLNRQALEKLSAVKHLAVIPGASHQFEEPGTLNEVAMQARDWFTKYFIEA